MATQRQFNVRPAIERIPGNIRHAESHGAGRDSAATARTGRVPDVSPPAAARAAKPAPPASSLQVGLSASALNSAMRQWK